MLKIEDTSVYGVMEAIRGMRNPLESHEKIDSYGVITFDPEAFYQDQKNFAGMFRIKKNKSVNHVTLIGHNDLDLMKRLIKSGPEHSKFMRMIVVYCDITGPLYWWKHFDTYRVGVAPQSTDIEMNSSSTMHKMMAHKFMPEMFSIENLTDKSYEHFVQTINYLNECRQKYLDAPEDSELRKELWWQIIQLLPSSWNQKRTVMLNYQVLANIYFQRRNHKLDEWSVDFMNWINNLPYSQLIKHRCDS